LTDRLIQTTISDLVQIPPHEFYKLSRDEVEDKINEKYSNRVRGSEYFLTFRAIL
jgi:DNA-directed RNA polymerase subunit E'/Rpb7